MSFASVKWPCSTGLILFTFFGFGPTLAPLHYVDRLGVETVEAGQASSPDLVVRSLSNPPTSVVAGTVTFSITDTTENSGNATANPSTTRYRFSTDNTITSADPLLPVIRSIPSLKKNFSSTGTVSVNIPLDFTPGTYYLGACADDTGVITESNETNNCRASTTTIQVYPPTSLTVTPTIVSAGTSLTATWTQLAFPTSTDWIGLYVSGTANTAYITYIYVNCTSTPTVAVPAGSCFFSVPFWVSPGTYELRLQWNNGFTTRATSNPFTVTSPPPPAKLAITSVNGGVNPTAGTGFPVIMQVQGEDGTPTIVSTSTNVSLSRTSGTGILGGTLTGTISANAGQATISGVTYTKAENGVILTATQTSGASLAPGESAPFAVNAGPAATLDFTTQPTSSSAGGSLSGPPTVVVRDSLGNNVTSTTSISIALGCNSSGATLSGTTTKNTSSGLASFDDLTINKSANGYTLVASAAGLTSVTSQPFLVNPGTATTLAFLTQPNNATTSSAIPGPPSVVVRDNQGNTVTNASASIAIGIGTNPGSGTLSGTTVKNTSGGVSAFADLKINQTGNGYTLTATSAGLTSATTNPFNIANGGSVAGTVSKTIAGDSISGASVQARQAGVVKGTTSTNSGGNYTISGLSPGSYDIRVDAGGFSPQSQSNVAVVAGSTTTANFSLAAVTPSAGIVYIYDELQRLKSVIDPVGEAATYTYDAVGNLLSITRNNSSQTSIVDFNPNGSSVGNTVTIYGTGYSATPSQNNVTFNGVAATVVSSTLTQIVTTVPAGATTGPIAVTSPAGGATSVSAFAVSGASTAAPTIASFNPTIGTAGTTVTITGTNFDTTQTNNEVRFSPALATVSTATTTSINTSVPVGARSGKLSVSTPGGTAISSQDFLVPPAGSTANDVDFTGRITIGGPALVMPVNTADKVAIALFDGVAGQRFSIKVSNSTFPDGGAFTTSASLTILKPDGFQFGASYGWHSPNGSLYQAGTTSPNFLDVQTLPMTGTYMLILDPSGSYTGQATITMYDIPPDLQGPIVPGGAPVNVVTTIPGQNGSLTFTGSLDQLISVKISNSTYPDLGSFTESARVNLIKPDGSLLAAEAWHSANGVLYQAGTTSDNFLDTVKLPVSGTYTLQVDPNWTHTGQATITLYDVPAENQGTITPGGSAVSVATPVPGQTARLTFTGTASQLVSVLADNSTYPDLGGFTTSATLLLLKPDGSQLSTMSWHSASGGLLDDQLLPVSGTYTLRIDPNWTHTGQVQITLNEITPIDQGTLSPFDPPVTASTTAAYQVASLTFAGTQGDQLSLQMANVTVSSSTVTVLKPDGTVLTSTSVGTSGGVLFMNGLPVSGTYSILMNPTGTNTGSMALSLRYIMNVTVGYSGKLRDRVGAGNTSLTPDGSLDGTFSVALPLESDNRTVTALDLRGPGIWDTLPSNGYWALGAASTLDSALYNNSNATVNFAVLDGGSFVIFASDSGGSLFNPGNAFTLTVYFGDGSVGIGNMTIP